MNEPVVIAVAITGSVPRKSDNPALPVTVAEQIASTQAAYEAGATLAHIHVRNDDETPSSDPDRFAAVQAGLRRHCPGMVVQFSTGGRGRDPASRGLSLQHRPDMASLSTGSVNFPTIVYENHATLVTDLAGQMKQFGVRPEIEIFDLSHLHGALRLVEAGLIDDRPHVV
jgi:3-keto-5-aminohexanoate cleavage enzyme